MKRIMFNDRFGLTEAALEGKKTVTRRIAKVQPNSKIKVFSVEKTREGYFYAGSYYHTNSACRISEFFMPPYKVGEVVAVAQSYFALCATAAKVPYKFDINLTSHKGWCSKMFVRADLMPHQIRILDVRAEKLQAITDEDCLAEGILLKENRVWCNHEEHFITDYRFPNSKYVSATAKEAFATLINKISGKGTWNANPWVWRIEFELIK